jgi:hypothetical protein
VYHKQQSTDRQRAVQTHPTDYRLLTPNQDTFPEGLSLFASVKDQTPLGFASLVDIADQVRTCPRIKAATEAILKDHREGILDGWKTIAKAGYQDQKTKTLPAVLPAGAINTRDTAQKRTITPSGYVCLDLDENTPAELRSFAKRVKAGKFRNVALCALSVSGRLNGSLALFMRVRMPKSWKSTPQATRKALGLNKNAPWTDNLNTINEAYHRAFSYLFKTHAGINVGKAGKSIYNVRYF